MLRELVKLLFLGICVRVFLEEISILICKLNKEDHPHQWLVIIQSIEDSNRTKEQKEDEYST